VVGKPAASKSFTIYTNVITGQSGVLGKVPVDLSGEDPELFQAYLNCVYFGAETIEQWADELQALVGSDEPTESVEARREKELAADVLFTKLIQLYLLAERLVDLKTVNIVTSEIIRFSDAIRAIPTQISISLAYAATAVGSPLRRLLRDFWIYDGAVTSREHIRAAGFPVECLQDIAVAMLRIAHEGNPGVDLGRQNLSDLCSHEVCRYHQHDEMHPECSDEDSGM
jgi:hypothetical protein